MDSDSGDDGRDELRVDDWDEKSEKNDQDEVYGMKQEVIKRARRYITK